MTVVIGYGTLTEAMTVVIGSGHDRAKQTSLYAHPYAHLLSILTTGQAFDLIRGQMATARKNARKELRIVPCLTLQAMLGAAPWRAAPSRVSE
jgi:hypothetical protein